MQNLVIGVLAHADAGKTTRCEALLYRSGAIRTLGRVDHRNAHLDTEVLERERGITIFSHQARFSLPGDISVDLLDTPGHADFSAEAERTLSVLDAAVLVISAASGVQAHTETLWALLARYNVPVFIFVTKNDIAFRTKDELLRDLSSLSEKCVDFSLSGDDLYEACALNDEAALENYIEKGSLSDEDIKSLIKKRSVFPCFFGSGLRLQGIDEFLEGLGRYAPGNLYPAAFSASVFKILHDPSFGRLSFMKITGGSLKVRSLISYFPKDGSSWISEKVSAIRRFSGTSSEAAEEVSAGAVVAVAGLSKTFPGQMLGEGASFSAPVLEPLMSFRMLPPKDTDPHILMQKLTELAEEDPLLSPSWDSSLGEIHIKLMGPIQKEVLISLLKDRFGADVEIDSPRILYKETISGPVEGIGHFEPLRHYAEVHLALEPLPRDSGIVITSSCSEDLLDRNYQRLILSVLAEKEHRGVLTGSPLTDVKITLLAGRAHVKHTEGGDFREAALRAVRQGLMQANSVLLEPQYCFKLTVPSEQIGRAISDIRLMKGSFEGPASDGAFSSIEGKVGVEALGDYSLELAAWSKGRGKLSCTPSGFDVCKNGEEVIASIGYDPDRDTENPSGSIFCSHGAGTFVPWNEVPKYMHLDTGYGKVQVKDDFPRIYRRNFDLDDKELEEIMQREFGPIKRRQYAEVSEAPSEAPDLFRRSRQRLIIDGYNLIFSWPELTELALSDMDLARSRLLDMLENFSGFTKSSIILVFDGYRLKGSQGEKEERNGVNIVYTKESETADAYIESLASGIGKNEEVTVVTSDNLIRVSAMRSGVLRMSSESFRAEVETVQKQIEAAIAEINMKG